MRAQLGRPPRQRPQYALAVALLLVVLRLIGVLLTLGQHRADLPSQLVRRSGDGLGLVHSRAQPAVVRPQRRLAAAQRRGGQAQGLGGAIDHALGLGAHGLGRR